MSVKVSNSLVNMFLILLLIFPVNLCEMTVNSFKILFTNDYLFGIIQATLSFLPLYNGFI